MKKEKQEPQHLLTRDEFDTMWEAIQYGVQQRRRKRRVFYSAAASIILLFTLGGLFGYHNLRTPDAYFAQTGELTINLRDGSMVTLLKGAKLTVQKSFPQKTRDVYLEGNAVFTVSKSQEHPFIVHGEDYNTTVLGTVFKVTQSGKNFSVDLYEGRVAISEKENQAVVYYLKPNQTFSNYGKTTIATIKPSEEESEIGPDISGVTSATKSDFHFRNCNLKDAISVIEDSYAIKIDYPEEYGNVQISTDLIQSKESEVMNILTAYLNLKLTKHGHLYQLKK